jgi:hypothetical protein
MKYPLFLFEQFSYIFVPDIKVTENILDQLQEIYVIYAKPNPCYVFVGLDKCYLFSITDMDNVKEIPLNLDIPDIHHLINFTSSDDSEYKITLSKKTKDDFKTQLLDILKNLRPLLDITLVLLSE